MRRTPHRTNHSSPITVPNKGMPQNRASLCVLSWSSLHSSLLSEYFFFHVFNSFRPSSLANNFWISGARNRAKESMMDCGSSILYGFWWFSWPTMGELPQQQNLTGSTSVHLTLLPGDTQLPKIVPIHRGETDHFKTWENSHRAPFPPLPFRGFHQKIPHKIARIGREWIELNWVYLSFSFYLPSGFRTSRKRITVLIRLVFQSSGVPQPDFLKSVFETAS